jgi:hypothetical protein
MISVRAFLTALHSELSILADLDAPISGEAKGSLDWVVTDLQIGSLLVEVGSRSRYDDRNSGPEVAKRFVNGLGQLETEGSTPPYFSDITLRSAKKMLGLIGRNGATGLEVSTHPDEIITLSPRAAMNIDELLPSRYTSLGSIEGKLEMISIHGPSRFLVYHARTHKAVNCKFDQARWLDKVKDALGHRVNVSGTVHYNSRGEPMRVDITDIRRLRIEEELPTVAELAGSDPNFTGGLDTSEHLRGLRVG